MYIIKLIKQCTNMISNINNTLNTELLSHNHKDSNFRNSNSSDNFDLISFQQNLEQRLLKKNPNIDKNIIKYNLNLLQELASFELGQFLLSHRGLNGYWTDYITSFDFNNIKNNISELEKWFLTKAPGVIAARERFNIYKLQTILILQTILNKKIKNKQDNKIISLASIPCGLMRDLLSIDYNFLLKNNIKIDLYGIDLDQDSISQANILSKNLLSEISNINYKNSIHLNFDILDALKLDQKYKNHFDIITSNGLSVYIKDNEKIIELYKHFYNSLKPNGVLITSFNTPPNIWVNYNQEDVNLERILFKDIIQVNWQCYKTQEETDSFLKNAGFKYTKYIYDKQKMIPTVVAYKV